ncbi:involucrin-like [Sycon ciliatum]|uniref:involucrin-like n=1 Tax=Sycon ciliatum TaxID=27933 RepID=UPI0031F6820D
MLVHQLAWEPLLEASGVRPCMHVDQQQQKGEEVKESAASSTNSTRTLTGKSKPRANSEKKSKQQAEHVGTHTEPRTRSAATPWHAGKTVPSVDTETEYKDKANPRNAADKQQQEQQQKTQENQHQESTPSLEQRNTADQQQQQKKRQEEHQKTQENQHQESTPEEHQHLQTEQQNLHTASSDSQCPASSDSQCPASNDSQCPASSDSQCPASNDSQSPASSDVHQDSGQHQPKLQDTSTTSAPAKATPPRPGKRHAEDSPGSMSGIPCKMQPPSSSQ